MSNLEVPVPYSKKVYIGTSKIHGRGVIAKKNIKKGEIVFIVKGKKRFLKVHNEKEALCGDCWIGIGKNTWIDPVGYGRYLNHSSKPNCGIKGTVTVRAMRNIKTGEEITIDYSTTEQEPLWWLKDSVTGKKISSIQFLPKDKFLSYLPYIPKHFQKVYLAHNGKTNAGKPKK